MTSSTKNILVVDDNPDILDALDLLLGLHGYKVVAAASEKEALLILSRQAIDLVIQDMNLSEGETSGDEGRRLFYAIKEARPNLPIIVITAWTQLETAIELVKAGAVDYLPKPWKDEKLLALIQSAIDQNNSAVPGPDDIIYASPAMHDLMQLAEKVAGSNINVLITGPNGSGKEKLADIIHRQSDRAEQPIIKVNMGALPVELMEAELFGAEAGAFTGAKSHRIGRFEAANGGTLFLDEIGNLNLAGQMKLLRVLQSGEFEKLGSSVTQRVDVRVISATNEDLSSAIQEGKFRQDLYYRLNVVELAVPPLKQRKGDILPLARHFLGSEYSLTIEAERFLLNHHWPGNVRELENMCQRAMVFANNNTISEKELASTSEFLSLPEEERLRQILEKHNWIIARAAKDLGLSRQALYRRMEKFNLAPKQ